MNTMRNLGLGAVLALVAAGCGDSSSSERGGEIPRGLGKADGSNSCLNLCGGQAPAGCWCDVKCESHGDCCPDKQRACEQQEPSCKGHCGGKSPAGCYCDDVCTQYGDCCSDRNDVCERSPACNHNGDCAAHEYCAFEEGACASPTMQLLQGKCAHRPDLCATVVMPVCGCDGRTYNNSCRAASAGVSVANQGPCNSPLPIMCGPSFPGDQCPVGQVCNLDSCSVDAIGQCVKSMSLCAGVYQPVCGCDGTTYDNECERLAAGAAKDHDGACKADPCAAQDARGEGMCMMFKGYAWRGSSCAGVSGCTCVGADCGNLYLDKASCEAAHASCADCWGAWIDQNGTCRTPADGVYPDSCCEDLKTKQCIAIDKLYMDALEEAAQCVDSPTFAPQCTITKPGDLRCNTCPVAINVDSQEVKKAEDAWKALDCGSSDWICPAVLCMAVDGPTCVNGSCKLGYL